MPGKITALEAQQRNKERVNVYLDGEYAFSLSLIEAARLRRDQVLTDAEIADLKARDTVERAFDRAARFLSYRPRSISEIRQNLKAAGIEAPAIDRAIERLEAMGYVDDLAFARYWVQNRDEFRPKGPLALRQELKQKGVSSDVIAQALDEVDFADAAYRAAQQQAARWQTLDPRRFREKMLPFLARRGFTAATCQDVVARLVEELELPDPETSDDNDWQE
jgi:regulatory protein